MMHRCDILSKRNLLHKGLNLDMAKHIFEKHTMAVQYWMMGNAKIWIVFQFIISYQTSTRLMMEFILAAVKE